MTNLIALALAAAQGPVAVQPAPAQPHAMQGQHTQQSKPPQKGAKPDGDSCSCCKGMAAGGKMECCAKHGEGHGGEHSGNNAHR